MKRLIIICILVFATIIGLFAYLYGIPVLIPKDPAYISIKEDKGIDKVYIDHAYIGTTPLIDKAITPGVHVIQISRNSTYATFTQSLSFEEKSASVITISLGPNLTYTNYAILSSYKTYKETGIICIPQDMQPVGSTQIDGKTISLSSFISLSSGSHSIFISSQSYNESEGSIIIQNGYTLFYLYHLARNPVYDG